MKKIICTIMLLAILMTSVICVQAAGSQVAFTGEFKVGGTVSVDMTKTAQNVMNSPGVTSDLYNAALEKNMDVMWKCSNSSNKYGSPVTWTAEDAGKEYVCRIEFYADQEKTQFIDYIDSDPFVISAGQPAVEVKLSPEGPFYLTVGKVFRQQLSCNVEGVTFENFRTSFPDGIDISPEGLISGTPTKEGFWFVTIASYKDGEQIGDLGVEFHVSAESVSETPQVTTEADPEKIDPEEADQPYPSHVADTDHDDPAENAPSENGDETKEREDSGDIWLFVAIGLGVLVACMVVAIVVLLKKKKA